MRPANRRGPDAQTRDHDPVDVAAYSVRQAPGSGGTPRRPRGTDIQTDNRQKTENNQSISAASFPGASEAKLSRFAGFGKGHTAFSSQLFRSVMGIGFPT